MIIMYQGKLYDIMAETFETIEDTYTRGWYIIKNHGEKSYKELHSMSIMMLNEKKGMEY